MKKTVLIDEKNHGLIKLETENNIIYFEKFLVNNFFGFNYIIEIENKTTSEKTRKTFADDEEKEAKEFLLNLILTD